MVNPKISIVTVTYNCESIIEKTLESVNSLIYDTKEHIIIDGNSQDTTVDVVNISNNFDGIILSEPDSGLYDAMNKAMNIAEGDFIFFLNAGDVFSSQNILNIIFDENFEYEKIYFGHTRIVTELSEWSFPYKKFASAIPEDFLPHHQSIFYPKSYYKKSLYDLQFKTHADIDFTSRAISSYPVSYIPEEISVSTMGGFATNTFTSFRKTIDLSRELQSIELKRLRKITLKRMLFIQFNCLVKFLACNILGNQYFFQLYRVNAKLQSLRF